MNGEILQRLENIEKLLALNITEEIDEEKSLIILSKMDYSSKELGQLMDMNPSTVRSKISQLREEGKLND